MIAQNLDDAYRAFDPLKPLSGALLQAYYVARDHNPIDRIRAIVLRSPETPDKILFTGHRGCGKSTEINRLLADPQVQQTLLVIPFSVADILDPLDLGYVDLLIAIEAALYRALRKAGVAPDEKLAKILADFWVPQARPIGFTEQPEREPLPLLDAWFEMLIGRYGKLRLEAVSREYLRNTFANRVSDLVSHIALLTAAIRTRLERYVLVAIDDLDKPDIATAQELFYRHATALTQPPCKILYTVPLPILYAAEFRSVARNFSAWFTLPNIKVHTPQGEPYEPGRAQMRQAVHCRMAAELIDDDALEHLITMSGGVLRELTTLMQIACNEARVAGAERITLPFAEQAVAAIRNEYQRSLRADSLPDTFTHRQRQLLPAH